MEDQQQKAYIMNDKPKRKRMKQRRRCQEPRKLVSVMLPESQVETLNKVADYYEVSVSFILNQMLHRPLKRLRRNNPLAFDPPETWDKDRNDPTKSRGTINY